MIVQERAWRRHTILFALLALMVAFEFLGRILSSDVLDALTQMRSGNGTGGAVFDAAARSLASGDFVFLNPRNITNLVLQVSVNGILAVGMTLVILTGGIDLSVGSVVALSGVILGLCEQRLGLGTGVALATTAVVGLLTGTINGVLIARFRIPAFVITLGMLVIARGLALILSGSAAIAPLSPAIRFIGGGFLASFATVGVGAAAGAGVLAKGWGAKLRAAANLQTFLFALLALGLVTAFSLDRGLPIPALVMAVVAAAGMFLTRATTFGRSLYAIGGNEPAAVLSGLSVTRIKTGVYALMGVLAAVSGVILAGRLNSATPTEGNLLELDAIASVVIGGASLTGGFGRVQGSIIGAFIIGTLNNGMDLLEISSNWQMVAKGLIIVFAVYSDAKLRPAI